MPPEQIIQHANVERQKPEHRRIFVKSNGLKRYPNNAEFQILDATVRIDFPSVIKTLAFITAARSELDPDRPKSDPQRINEFTIFEEDGVEREMAFEIDIRADSIKRWWTDPYHEQFKARKSSEIFGCYIAVRPKSFMSWNHDYNMVTIRGYQYAILKWLNIGEKTNQPEELMFKIVREDQRLDSESSYGALDGPFLPSRSKRGQASQILPEQL